MKFNDWVKGQRGRSLAIAQALGVTPPVVSDWAMGKKGIPVERCVAIERATNGEVTRQDLRPDDWQDIWPELAEAPANIAPAAIEVVAITEPAGLPAESVIVAVLVPPGKTAAASAAVGQPVKQIDRRSRANRRAPDAPPYPFQDLDHRDTDRPGRRASNGHAADVDGQGV